METCNIQFLKGEYCMNIRKKILSLVLAGCLTLGLALVASAHQTLTMDAVDAADNGNINLRWEPHFGRYIIGAGIINEEVTKGHEKTEVSGLSLLFGGRKYLSQITKQGDKFSGVFFEGDLSLKMVDMECKDTRNGHVVESKDGTITSVDVLAGYKFIAGQNKKSGFTAEAAAGPRFNFGDEFHGYNDDSTEAVVLINLGYTW